jgi:hypothetical protein
MRLIYTVLAAGLVACTFDATGLDATSAAPGTSTGPTPTTGSETGVTTQETPTTGPDTTGSSSSDGTVGVTTTEPVDTTGPTTTDGPATDSSTGDKPAVCGDGELDRGEGCDDGDLDDDDECTAQCQPADCGDGIVWVGMEACDDGDADEVTCTAECQLPTCDDQARNGDETDVDCGGSCPGCAAGQMCGGDDDCAGKCSDGTCLEFASCKEIKMSVPNVASGEFKIDPDQAGPEPPFTVYCEHAQQGGGWTMVLKVDGRKPTFVYSAPLWTDGNTFNVETGLNRVETKLQSFMTVPLTELLLGMEAPIAADGPLALKYIKLPATAASARALFMPGTLIESDLGRNAWKAWITGSSLQMHCNLEGINVQAESAEPEEYARVRIGIIGNENGAMDCGSPNSYIGVGGGGTGACVVNGITTTGNRAGCGADNGEKDLPGFAVVFVR